MNETRPLVYVEDDALLDEVLRLAAASACEVDLVPDPAAARRTWALAPLIVLDLAGVGRCLAAGLPKRARVLLVCAGEPPGDTWQRAYMIGADKVLSLPAEAPTLIEIFTDEVEGPAAAAGRVLAVLGGRGGAGASVFAAAVAQMAVRCRRNALLVDCDPLGGGLDLVLGLENREGIRWRQVQVEDGRLPASALRTNVPTLSFNGANLTVLSCDRSDGVPDAPSPAAVAAVVDAGRRSGDTVICDLPRDLAEGAAAALERADLAVLVVPAEIRACAAAKRLAERVKAHGVPAMAVVRGPAPGGLSANDVAAGIGLPLLTSMRPESALEYALECGLFAPRKKGALGSAAHRALMQLDEIVRRRQAPTGQRAAA